MRRHVMALAEGKAGGLFSAGVTSESLDQIHQTRNHPIPSATDGQSAQYLHCDIALFTTSKEGHS